MASRNFRNSLKRNTLAIALGMCFATPVVLAQSTTGSINGTVAGGAGSKVMVTNGSGFSRTVSVDASGRYSIGSLPIGQYKVVVERDGKTVGSREVAVIVGRSADVSFADATTLETIEVVGANVPPVDVSGVDSRSVITSDQLLRMPIARSAEAIALLAPGANSGASGQAALRNLVSFGGAGVSENAYYINGYYVNESVSNLGGFSLPYGSIDQQETYTGGYSARYGRSDGGVINQIGKSGSNELHYGGQVVWSPKKLRSDEKDTYYPDLDLPAGYEYSSSESPGNVYRRDSQTERWSEIYSGYIGGALIQDKLFAFVSAEGSSSHLNFSPIDGGTSSTHNVTKDPKIYAKINWNINYNNLLELTYLSENQHRSGRLFEYDFETGVEGNVLENAFPNKLRTRSEFTIAKYTSFLTDALVFNASYGHGRFKNVDEPFSIPGAALISNPQLQNPALNGGTPIVNDIKGRNGRNGRDYTDGLRLDLEWTVGDHAFTGGIDNLKTEAKGEGQSQTNAQWVYGRTTRNISAALGVGSPVSASNPSGYYVYDLKFFTATDMSVTQKAFFLEDRWQVSDNVLLSLGLRNDQFKNKNNNGEAYMDAKNQWAPRIGAAWDVFGDSSLKVYGNAGRYFLAMPNNVAIRGASSSTFTREYFTYTGIDAQGNPTGLVAVPRLDGATPVPVSTNGELGQPIDVLAFAPNDLKNMYQDEFILGFEKTFGNNWVYGAKATYRELKSAIDDVCDSARIADKAGALGLDADLLDIQSCYMFNPGGSNTFSIADLDANGVKTGTRTEIVMTAADWGFTDDAKREYKALDVFLEHRFDGKWEGRLDYTYSKLQGNTEGQVKSEFGQTNISKTQDWDAAQLMQFSDGYLFNDRRHQLKIRGSYQFAEEWAVGGKFTVVSGVPISCLGFFNPDGTVDEGSPAGDPVGYGSSYHTCFGQVAKPGAVRTPWTHIVDLGLTYRPARFDNHLALNVQVFNVFNERETTQVDVTSEDDAFTVSNTYLMPIGRSTPRFVQLSASVDF